MVDANNIECPRNILKLNCKRSRPPHNTSFNTVNLDQLHDMASQHLSCQEIDNTFHLHALYCRGGFDFTLLFEESILTLLPLCLFLIISPLRIVYLLRKRRKVIKAVLLPVKIVRSTPRLRPYIRFIVLTFLKKI